MHAQKWILINWVSERPTQSLVPSRCALTPAVGCGVGTGSWPRHCESDLKGTLWCTRGPTGVCDTQSARPFVYISQPCPYVPPRQRWTEVLVENVHQSYECIWPVQSKPRLNRCLYACTVHCICGVFFFFFFLPSIQMSDGHFQVKPQWYRAILSLSFASFLCDWINYVSLTLLEVSKHTFSVISHQSMWPWRWKVKHVSQEAGQRGIRQLISGPTQSHHSTLAWELKLSLLAMYSELEAVDLWCMMTWGQGPLKSYFRCCAGLLSDGEARVVNRPTVVEESSLNWRPSVRESAV